MTKLEQKLIELGYKGYYNSLTFEHRFYKRFSKYTGIYITIKHNEVTVSYIQNYTNIIYEKKQIEEQIQAFNQLQNDLKELKQVDNE